MVDYKKLAVEIHEAAVQKGFWDVNDAVEKHAAKMISELGEVIQADRAGIMYEIERDGAKPEGVVAELADFAMMTLDLCEECGFYVPNVDVSAWRECNDEEKKHYENLTVYNLVGCLNATFVAFGIDNANLHALEIIWAIHHWLLARGYDLPDIIREKMNYNKSRPALHGRLY